MQISFTVTPQPLRQPLDEIRADLPDIRRRFTRNIARTLLHRVILLNPVETGRSRAAWAAALEQLGDTAPNGWLGPQPRGSAVRTGREAGRATLSSTQHQTIAQITNAVPYVLWLEYGTRRRAPFHMVSRAILDLQQQLRRATGGPTFF